MREPGEMPVAPVIYRLTYCLLIASDAFWRNLPTAFREEPINHRGVATELGGNQRTAFALSQTGMNHLAFFGADAPLGFYHQTKAPALRPRRQRRVFPRGRTAGPPSRACRPPSGLSKAGHLCLPTHCRNPNPANYQSQHQTYSLHYSASGERESFPLSLCTGC